MTEEQNTLEQQISRNVNWLRQQLQESGAAGLLVGVSGGIDSALVAHLIKRAAPDNSLAVILPCHSNHQDKKDALAVIESCGIKYCEIDLAPAFDQLTAELRQQLGQRKQELQESSGLVPVSEAIWQDNFQERAALANLKARLRMSTLYFIANGLNYLVIGTDNAAETYTGYFTKYGDGGADLLPLANLLKREVYLWARFLGVPETVLTKAPSAGLWDEQTDEGEMGTTYQMIDDFLSGQEICETDRQIIERLHRISAHKRCLPRKPES